MIHLSKKGSTTETLCGMRKIKSVYITKHPKRVKCKNCKRKEEFKLRLNNSMINENCWSSLPYDKEKRENKIKKINSSNTRTGLKNFVGKIIFTYGTPKRLSHKNMLIKDLKTANGNVVADHIWIKNVEQNISNDFVFIVGKVIEYEKTFGIKNYAIEPIEISQLERN